MSNLKKSQFRCINAGFLLNLLVLLVPTLSLPASASSTQSPNIIFFLADDLGWSDVGVDATTLGHASDFYQTPNIERLAARGMSFNNAYASAPNCAPTRAAILTGQYPVRATNRVFSVGGLNLKNEKTLLVSNIGDSRKILFGDAFTLPEMLKTKGYITGHIGKYHVGKLKGDSAPINQGFDYVVGQLHGGPRNYFSNGEEFVEGIDTSLNRYAGDYTPAQSLALSNSDVLNGQRKHLTDAITDAAIDFMRQTQASTASPFFLHIGHRATHSPAISSGRPDLVAKYDSLPDGSRHSNSDYAALVEGLDQSLGQILDFLETTDDFRNPGHKLIENTMIIFYSDNEPAEFQYHRKLKRKIRVTSTDPLSEGKASFREGGIRVPLIIALKGLTEEGSINETPVTSVDFYRTLAELANIDLESVVPPDYPKIDGESLVDILSDRNNSLTRQSLYWHLPGYIRGNGHPPVSIIRTADYKLVYSYETEVYQLYDVVNDLGETTDLIDNPEFQPVAAKMSQQLRRFLADNKAALPAYRATGNKVSHPFVIGE